MTEENHLAPFEGVIHRIPLPTFFSWALFSACVAGSITLMAYLSGELGVFLSDYAALALIFSFCVLVGAECWIGNNIRATFSEIYDTFSLTEYVASEVLNSIFKNRKRTLAGIMGSVTLTIGLRIFGFWYESLTMRIMGYIVAAIVGFMVGEMGYGSLLVMNNASQVGKMIAPDINILNSEQINALKNLAGWGLQISIIGSVIGSVLLPALVFAPWQSDMLPVSEIAFVSMIGILIFMLLAFFVPTERIHQTMQNIKQDMESTVMEHYMEIYDEITTSTDDVSKHSPLHHQALASKLESLDRLHLKIQKAPTWPFDVSQVRKLFGSVIVPIMVYIFQNYSVIMTVLGLR